MLPCWVGLVRLGGLDHLGHPVQNRLESFDTGTHLIVTRGLEDEVIVNIRAMVEAWSSILDPEWSSRS